MAHIEVPAGLPGITGLLEYRQDTAHPIRELTQFLLRGPNTLSEGERELIATLVSHLNACRFCATAHTAAADLLPPAIAGRVKQPYRAPDSTSFVGSEAAYAGDLLSADAIASSGLFNPHAAAKLLEKCRRGAISGFRDNAALVGTISTQLWYKAFAERQQEPNA
jgi:alkylhydroperoxidase family enzyme